MTELSLAAIYANHVGKQSDKWSGYLPVYDRIFSPLRQKPIRLLEIGVQNGGSLEIWARYFPDAIRLVGCDIEPACALLRYDDPRIAVVVGDANSDSAQAQIIEHSDTFDIVIDDGSHRSSDIVHSFCRYFPLLEPGGIFVAEDLHCSYWMEYEGGLHDPASSIAFFKTLVDIVHRDHWGVVLPKEELLVPFILRYGPLEFDYSEIASVEFVDSICIVRKNQSGHAGLGQRVIAGEMAEVNKEIAAFHDTNLVSFDQSKNPYLQLSAIVSTDERVGALVAQTQRERERHLEEYGELVQRFNVQRTEAEAAVQARAEAERQITAYRETVQVLKTSLSWRITAPLRSGLDLARALSLGPKYIQSLFRLGGGPIKTLRLVAKVLSEEGWGGVRWRLDNARTLMAPVPEGQTGSGSNDYQEWIRRYDTLDDEARERMRRRIAEFRERPLISVVMPVYNPPLDMLEEAIKSVRAQIYPHWELCVADDASPDEAVRNRLLHHAREDARIKFVFRGENGHISAASNSALELASGDFVALMDHDDMLPEHALYWVAEAINRHPDAQLIYSDEDKITADGLRYDPYFKCELNRELLLAQNMISHLGVYRRATVEAAGRFRGEFNGAQDYDLALRVLELVSPQQVVHIPRVLYHWRAIQGSTALSAGEKNYAADAGQRAVAEHLQRIGVDAQVMPAPQAPAMNRVRYALPEKAPLVSILIPTRDRADLLERCIESIQTKSTWQPYEIIVIDNGSVQPDTFQLFNRLQSSSESIRILRDNSTFNYSALNNRAASEARGDVLCLMNNDIEVQSGDWMEEMLSFAMRTDIGCVGARLWYPNGTLQHGGVVLGVGGVANHAFKHLSHLAPGYFGRAVLHQSFSAVTGACLMVRKEIYDQFGGLDEQLAVAFNDIDFCLRVREAGYRNVWTPYAEFVHHESLSRGTEDSPEKQARFESEVRFMQMRWGELLMSDPAYSPNLTLDREDFTLAWNGPRSATHLYSL